MTFRSNNSGAKTGAIESTNIRQEVIELAGLAQKRDPECRGELYQSISNLFLRDEISLSDTEKEMMCDILQRLTETVDTTIRKRLAEQLASLPDAPHDLVLLLANDQIEIAHPILQESAALLDEDLIKIVYHKTRQHQMSIATRKMLSESVSSALVDIGNESIIVALLNNTTARIAKGDLEGLALRSREHECFQKPLLSREDMPPLAAKKMYEWVSDSLKEVISKNFDLSSDVLDRAVSNVVDELVEEDKVHIGHISQNQAIIDKLFESGKLKPSFLMKSLSQGEIELFELGFAKLANQQVSIMQKILYDRGSDGLAVACRAIGIDRSVFLTIFKLTRESRQMPPKISEDELAHAHSLFMKMDERKAELTIHRWAADESRAPIF